MSFISVIDIFNTSIGQIAVLDFPDDQHPRIGMILKRLDNTYWKIIGTTMPQLSTLTKGYNHFNPPRFLFSCSIQSDSIGVKLVVGDNLTISALTSK